MFILAFVGIGLFASADNGKVGKIKLPIEKEVKVIKTESPTKIYTVNIQCGLGNFWFGCCWDTAEAAMQAANLWLAANCNINSL